MLRRFDRIKVFRSLCGGDVSGTKVAGWGVS